MSDFSLLSLSLRHPKVATSKAAEPAYGGFFV
jgi:hypothetical protein